MRNQVGCFQHKKKKWLSSFYSLTIYFILVGFLFVLIMFLFVSSIFYSINYLLTVGSVVTLFISAEPRPFPPLRKTFMLVIFDSFLLLEFVLKV